MFFLPILSKCKQLLPKLYIHGPLLRRNLVMYLLWKGHLSYYFHQFMSLNVLQTHAFSWGGRHLPILNPSLVSTSCSKKTEVALLDIPSRRWEKLLDFLVVFHHFKYFICQCQLIAWPCTSIQAIICHSQSHYRVHTSHSHIDPFFVSYSHC